MVKGDSNFDNSPESIKGCKNFDDMIATILERGEGGGDDDDDSGLVMVTRLE